ncbi:MAG: DUF4199 domain-containing protein [Flavobacteriaceae bacterium]|nr:DUF4199 domain-containing protein [Flavobacteriaceae bacterium]
MKKYQMELKWAIIFMLSTLLWVAFEKSMGWNDLQIDKHQTYTNFFSIIAIAVYGFALVDKRKNFYEGKITWKQGFMSGVIITLLIIPLNILAQYISFTYITPDFFANMINYNVSIEKMTLSEAENYFSLQNYRIQALTFGTLIGFATSAIVALFVKNK